MKSTAKPLAIIETQTKDGNGDSCIVISKNSEVMT
jgi:hypothetical protein